MVFQPISSSSETTNSSMATAPVKSQPLHNFSLSFLKWGKNQMNNNHRCRKPHDSSRDSPSLDNHHHHRSSSSASESDEASPHKDEDESPPMVNHKNPIVGSRATSKNKFSSFTTCSSSTSTMEKPAKNPPVCERGEDVRSNLLIRFRKGGKDESILKNKSAVVALAATGEDRLNSSEVEESAAKPWNLRPRRAVLKGFNEVGGTTTQKNIEVEEKPENMLPKSLRLRGFAEAQNVEKKEKQKFSIALSRDDIEEDYFILTGSKLPRRPRKRPRNVQKQLDNFFPGLWLAGVTPESYDVPEVAPKK